MLVDGIDPQCRVPCGSAVSPQVFCSSAVLGNGMGASLRIQSGQNLALAWILKTSQLREGNRKGSVKSTLPFVTEEIRSTQQV